MRVPTSTSSLAVSHDTHFMLGGSDDLQAVLSVLDRLSNSLESNRSELDSTCTIADSFGGGAELPVELVQNKSLDSIKQSMDERQNECANTREKLENVLENVVEASSMLRALVQHEQTQQLQVHRELAAELTQWQHNVENVEAEKLKIATGTARIRRDITEMYEKLSTRN